MYALPIRVAGKSPLSINWFMRVRCTPSFTAASATESSFSIGGIPVMARSYTAPNNFRQL
jgi:hypothetical protein